MNWVQISNCSRHIFEAFSSFRVTGTYWKMKLIKNSKMACFIIQIISSSLFSLSHNLRTIPSVSLGFWFKTVRLMKNYMHLFFSSKPSERERESKRDSLNQPRLATSHLSLLKSQWLGYFNPFIGIEYKSHDDKALERVRSEFEWIKCPPLRF